MADASIDIRIFENKELKAVDMAELMDTAIFNSGVIQGCETKIENGLFTIEGGRIIVGGRLGVVTGGTVPNPTTLSKTDICYPIAVCDLADVNNPFYFMIATKDDLTSLGLDHENRSQNFNVQNGRDALFFGTVEVDPATGLIKQDTYQKWGQATARKGWDWYSEILNEIQRIDNKYAAYREWQYGKSRDNKTEMTGKTSQTWVLLPNDAREAFVTVWVRRSAAIKVAVDLPIPIHDAMFVTDASILTHVNLWASASDGFVEFQTLKDSSGRWIRLNRAYAGTTNITDTVTWMVLYR